MRLAPLRAFFLPEHGAAGRAPFAVVAAAAVAAAAVAALSAPAQRIDWMLYDVFTRRLVAGGGPAPGIVVVAIDEPSFAEIGQPWPWPRALHAALVDRLVQGGARSIAFDILFDVPAADPGDDEAFAGAVARSGRTILATDQAAIEDRGYALTQWTDPIEALAARAVSLGAVRIPFDPDGALRRTWLEVDGRPTLAAAIAARQPGIGSPAASDAPRLIRFNGPPRRGILTVSYYQALDPAALPKDIFRDRHVLIGRSLGAPPAGTADHFPTPAAEQMSGVEVHATVLDGLLRDRFVADPLGRPIRQSAAALSLGAVAALLFYTLAPVPAILAAAALAALWVAAAYASLGAGVRLPVVAPLLAVAAGYSATAAYRFALVRRERRLIKRAFQHYVAPAIVEQMLADPSRLKLGGTEYDVTVLFSDLEGFTTLGERLTASELSAHLSEYFKAMLDVLLPQHGTLDKLIGDAIMMYFGCPLPDPQHALQACRGALAMQRQMRTLDERWAAAGLPRLRTRIGINSGRAVAGNMGTDTIFNYTILGDTVNLASRLEGVNKEYGTLIILGEDTRQRIGDAFEVRELDWIRVKGKDQPVAIYELAGEAGTLPPERRAMFAQYASALDHYRRGRFTEAIAGFDAALQIDPTDGPSGTLRSRCAGHLDHPGGAWDGVHVMKTK